MVLLNALLNWNKLNALKWADEDAGPFMKRILPLFTYWVAGSQEPRRSEMGVHIDVRWGCGDPLTFTFLRESGLAGLHSLLLSAVRPLSSIIGCFIFFSEQNGVKCRKVRLNLQKVRQHGVTRGSLFSGTQAAAHKHCLPGQGVINPFPSNLKALNRKRLPNHSPPKP